MSRLPVVGVLGTPGGLLLAAHDIDEAIDVLGENTGNMMFQYACWKLLRNPKVDFNFRQLPDIDWLRRNIDVLLIPAANQLNPNWDLGWWADFLEKLDKPVIVVGLGAQSKMEEEGSIALQPGTVRYLHVLARRANVIGVRGASTLQVLRQHGVQNGVITGCPSNFINPEVDAAAIAGKIEQLGTREAPTVNHLFGTMEDYAREPERRMTALCRQEDARIVYQTNRHIFHLLARGAASEEARKYFAWERAVLSPDLSLDDYIARIAARGRFFVNAMTWLDEVGRDDLSVGMRIHGAVAAIQGNSLGVCVAFDSRTLELVQTMGYPYVLADDLQKIERIRELPSVIQFSADGFEEARRTLRGSLKLAMEQFGVETTL